MNKSEFNYYLPEELIAQTPLDKRDSSRLMCLKKSNGEISHKHFYDLLDLVNEGDCLVFNNSRVLPARLIGEKNSSPIEILLLRDCGDNVWECLVRPGKKCKKGARISFGDGKLVGEIIGEVLEGNRLVKFEYEGIFLEIIEELGQMPLPPYIKARLDDADRYQTVYSKELGSAAAPTAGLHFTPELLDKLNEKGVKLAFLTLHVGLGTFRPVKEEKIESHVMHSEYYTVDDLTAKVINDTKRNGGRIIAVGTTSTRTLETLADENGFIHAGSGNTDIFIYPGYKFKIVDALITNFHLPESTLIMLVSALAGKENVLSAYKKAVDDKYRFFSFGDAMFIY